jgi:hypothetical protein
MHSLPIKPSPTYQTTNRFYTLACAFEGTNVSVGRGTENNFKFMAHPICHKVISVLFQTNMGAQNPVYNGVACFEKLSNEHRLQTRNCSANKTKFFNPFYKTGRNTKLQQQIEDESQKLTLERAGKPV